MTDTNTEYRSECNSQNLEREREIIETKLKPIESSFADIDLSDFDSIDATQEAIDSAAAIVFTHDHETIAAAKAKYESVKAKLESAFISKAISDWTQSDTPDAERYREEGGGFPLYVIEEAQETARNALKELSNANVLSLMEDFAIHKFFDEYAPMIANTREQSLRFPYYKALKPLTDEGFFQELKLISFTLKINEKYTSAQTNEKCSLLFATARNIERDYDVLKEAVKKGTHITTDDILKVWNNLLRKPESQIDLDLVSGFVYELTDPPFPGADRTNPNPKLETILRAGQYNRHLLKVSSKYLLIVLLCSMGLGHRIYELLRGDSIPEVSTIAAWENSDITVDHSFPNKGIREAIYAIAYANSTKEAEYEHKPKSAKSEERYIIKGNHKAAFRFVTMPGVTPQYVDAVSSALASILSDPKGNDFTDNDGFLLFTENYAIEVMRRTEGGTVKGKDYKAEQLKINAALEVFSSLLFQGVSPDGYVHDQMPYFNATKHSEVKYNGNTLKNVWRVHPKDAGVLQYASARGYLSNYPLLALERPKTPLESIIEPHVRDMCHQLRGMLYDKNGKRRPRKDKDPVKIEIRWDTMFRDRYQSTGKQLSTDQRKKIIRTYYELIDLIAQEEAYNPECHHGRPLYIWAKVTRKPSKGKRQRMPEKLIIDATATVRNPTVEKFLPEKEEKKSSCHS